MRKIKFHPGIFIFTLIILMLIGLLCVKGTEYNQADGEYREIDVKDYLLEAEGYDIKDNNYRVNNEDPKLIFDFSKETVYGFEINLGNKINLSNVKLYYGWEDTGFSEEASYTMWDEESNNIKTVSLHPYKYLRIDIDENISINNMKIVNKIDITPVRSYFKYGAAIIASIIAALGLSLIPQVRRAYEGLRAKNRQIICSLKRNKFRIFIFFMINIGLAAGTVIIEEIYGIIKDKEYINPYRMLVIFAVLFITALSIYFRKNIGSHAHIYYFIVIMVIGTVNVLGAPPAVGISFDDEIHYGRTAYLSWGATGNISYQDNAARNVYVENIREREVYNKEGRNEWADRINRVGNKTLIRANNYTNDLVYIAYIPGAITLKAARGLGLSFTQAFVLGKWINLLIYSILFSCSIKILEKKGKIIAAMIGLIPTSLFMATSYSYDWWIIAFVVLGFSIFARELQLKKKISVKKMLLIVICMVIGMLPKAIYFPLMLPLLLLGKDKYEKSKKCRTIVLCGMLVLLATFVLPIIFGGMGSGDIRGGTDVNSTEQVKYILTRPLEYAKTLISFLLGYISLDAAGGYLTFMAYYGQAQFFGVCIVVLAVAAVLDNSRISEHKTKLFKVYIAGAIGITIVLVATALYVSFTSVGAGTIAGCQPRYLIPVIFPALYFLCDLDIAVSGKIKTNALMLGTCIMSYIFLYGIYDLCIAYY